MWLLANPFIREKELNALVPGVWHRLPREKQPREVYHAYTDVIGRTNLVWSERKLGV